MGTDVVSTGHITQSVLNRSLRQLIQRRRFLQAARDTPQSRLRGAPTVGEEQGQEQEDHYSTLWTDLLAVSLACVMMSDVELFRHSGPLGSSSIRFPSIHVIDWHQKQTFLRIVLGSG